MVSSSDNEDIKSTRERKNDRKIVRKQRRAQHRLLRELNINSSDTPTEHLMVCNAGLLTGLERETLDHIVGSIVSEYELIMPPRKSYCFVEFVSKIDAQVVYDKVHGRVNLPDKSTPFYLSYTKSVPRFNDCLWNSALPLGLTLIEDFVTEEEEDALLRSISWHQDDVPSSELKHRQVKHFGYEFRYDTNNVDCNNPIVPIPEEYEYLQSRFKERNCGKYTFDQLTINRYLPGQGIPPHIDTHSAFEDTILSLSLGSSSVMDFKRGDMKAMIFLPARSLLVMSGEARYAWSHGICPRHNDIIKVESGLTTRPRGTRTSFTFRKVLKGDCRCQFNDFCDTPHKTPALKITSQEAPALEQSYVHEVYEGISDHFDETRRKQWPKVVEFLDAVEIGGILLDIGCGNGKYLHRTRDVFKIGCDRSRGLAEICRKREFEILLADNLQLPYKDNSVDAAISIAVIHHLSTHERRKQAISEITRVLRPKGKCLIYVWAMEQNRNSTKSTYLRFGTSKTENKGESQHKQIVDNGLSLPIHENRTDFTHHDMLVPWKLKKGQNFLRYYHLFEEGELSQLCSEISSCQVNEVYYDQGNWCAILEKGTS
ncbi:alkylated DNA repair protein alkB homolog 8 [Orussus abietinus]|uniref:alkylated DNA repair protein alkB homolog 8 n=1 Tax=Orussus abietinus TaxID=222816 RepID=UPI0006260501|nr:alkylated DNA repair protein alkB homolog 8 [Orussus abietinus]